MTKWVRPGVLPRFTRAQLEIEAQSRVGCRRLQVARSTGTLVGLYEAQGAGLDVSSGPWVTVCETHGGLVHHDTRALAESHLSHPDEWCPVCQGEEDFEQDYSDVGPVNPIYLTCWVENDEVYAHSSAGNHLARPASLPLEDRFDDAKKALNRMIAGGHGHRVEVLVGRATEALGFRTDDCEVIA